MTLEITRFKCPYCGQVLGEEEAKRAELKKQKEIDDKVQQKVQQEIELAVEKVRIDTEKQEKDRTERLLAEQKTQMELKYEQENAEKERQRELKYEQENAEKERQRELKYEQENAEKERQKEDDYNQKKKEFEIQFKRIEDHNKELSAEVEKQKRILESISPELNGTSGEFVLIDELREEFRTDDIIGKKVGVQMADVIQNIVTENGERVLVPDCVRQKNGQGCD